MKGDALKAAIIAQIHLGVAMARSSGVVCGSPRNIRINPIPKPTKD